MLKRKIVLVVRYLDLPEDVQDELREWHLFGNDRLLELITSYRLGDGPQEPANMLQESNFQQLYAHCKEGDNFAGSFDEFLVEYRLRALYWVTMQKPDLQGIDQVLVDVSW